MDRLISSAMLGGSIAAIPSKSDAHRLLFCAALSDGPTEIVVGTGELSADIRATMACIEALGGRCSRSGDTIRVKPIDRDALTSPVVCDCGESGSTARFLLPVAAMLAERVPITLIGHGRLPARPFAPLCDALRAGGAQVDRDLLPITVSGGLVPGEYRIAGNISSQYITGLLLALPALGEASRITLTTPLESRGYIDMTCSTLARFGVEVEVDEAGYTIPASPYRAPGRIVADGDWSNAAFWLSAGAISSPVTVIGLSRASRQGDRAVVEVLRQFGAAVSVEADAVTVAPGHLRGITLSVADIPDLVPVLAVVASLSEGETRFTDAARLRLKESDRLATVAGLITDLGGRAAIEGDTLVIVGQSRLRGGVTDSANDHRIAMSAAVAALGCDAPVTLRGAEAVAKSYPDFWADYAALGGRSAKL